MPIVYPATTKLTKDQAIQLLTSQGYTVSRWHQAVYYLGVLPHHADFVCRLAEDTLKQAGYKIVVAHDEFEPYTSIPPINLI